MAEQAADRAAGEPIGVLTRIGAVAVRAGRRVVGAWQRSIQLRVVTGTMTLSLIVVGLLGVTLLRQISDGLLEAQAQSAMSEASTGIESAQAFLDAGDDARPESQRELLYQVLEDSAARGIRTTSADDRLFEVILRGEPGSSATFIASRREIMQESVPEALREAVRDPTNDGTIYRTYTSIQYRDGGSAPALVVGGLVTTQTFEQFDMYYLFPLTEQQNTLDLVTAALTAAGALLILLLAALSWLITRQVVTPVRMAARIAERFSAGNLSERMSAKGRDDLAKLATSFNQMASSLQRQIGQLEELSRMQQQFVSDVSHELRTPLTTVRMAADVLYESRDEFDPVVERSAELLQAQLDRFEILLTDLLEISRFDAGAAVLNAEAVDVRDLVHGVVDGAAVLAAEKGSDVVLDLPHDPVVATVDGRRVQRVLRNLVVNAIEHGDGRPVTVRVRTGDDAVAIAVRDRGVGLKPGESSLVFHRFWRADPARARTTGGTGLGLSISLEDARLHGGWLQAWGEPGEGSQFLLTLPCRPGVELHSSPLPAVPEDEEMPEATAGSDVMSPESVVDTPDVTTAIVESGESAEEALPGPEVRTRG